MTDYFKTFDIWQSEGTCIATSVCAAGEAGAECRLMNEAGSKLVHTFQAWSEIDSGQKYYDFMDFGTYQTHWPDLAVRPYFFTDALDHLETLKKPLRAMREFVIMGDGAAWAMRSTALVPSPIPRIVVQDGAVFAVDIWISGEYGGHGEPPLNEADLISQAGVLLRSTAPELLARMNSTYLICSLDIARQMQWPAYDYAPDKPGVSQ